MTVCPEVPVQEVFHIDEVLLPERLIEAVVVQHPVHRLLGEEALAV